MYIFSEKKKMNRKYINKYLEEMKDVKIHFKENKLIGFTDKAMLYLSRATGLRTKNRRKIYKRFKKTILEAIINGIRKEV